jgi:biotin operon repressor
MSIPETEPTTVSVEDFTILIAKDLALALPMYRLTALQYDVWHTMQRGTGQTLVTLAELAHRLGTTKTNVSPAVAALRERGLLWRKHNGQYQISPRIAFKGSVEEWNAALDALPPDAPEVVLPAYDRRPPRPVQDGRAKLSAVK